MIMRVLAVFFLCCPSCLQPPFCVQHDAVAVMHVDVTDTPQRHTTAAAVCKAWRPALVARHVRPYDCSLPHGIARTLSHNQHQATQPTLTD
jgi:hypothetical protein